MASYGVGDIRNLFNAGSDATKARASLIRLAIFVEEGAARHLLEIAHQYLNPNLSTGMIHVESFVKGGEAEINTNTDFAIIIASSANESNTLYSRLARQNIPVKILTDNTGKVSQVSLSSFDRLNPDDYIEFNAFEGNISEGLRSIGLWMLEVSPDELELAIAANFPFARKALAEKIVKETSKQNALVGGVTLVPGADMPVMTLNQAKMVLQIAAAYGQEMGPERVKELAGVIGGGFALRAVARNVIGVVPALGWAVKAGIGYSGTMAMGKAVIEYFESGGSLQGIGSKLFDAGDKIAHETKKIGAKVSETAKEKAPLSLPFRKKKHPNDEEEPREI